MIRFKIYRRIRVLLGARSFVLEKPGQATTYLLVGGGWTPKIMQIVRDMGYVEEWEKTYDQ